MTKEMTLDQTMLDHSMFSGSMLETSWAQRSRRSWTTLTSFGLQAVVMGLLLLLPLWRTVSLPSVAHTVSTPISLGQRSPDQTQVSGSAHIVAMPVSPDAVRFVAPGRIPPTISMTGDESSPAPIGNIGVGSGTDTIGAGARNGFLLPTTGNWSVPAPPPSQPTVREFRTSRMLEGSLLHRVQPIYPPLARTAHIQGEVVLFAVISKSGNIDNLRVLSGHPMLAPAAVEAVSQWRYRPYVLNGEPIEVETQITVNFTLSGN
jgi:periplasmic protein TonB